ncbi:MAG: hypothetical protein KZQ93_18075 [Candidatus Thiodiazotropha sp. (ex Monitilora ramsayi)]|nr:hypothetical protein [Candidatus Thiodiazotropha sp. (ex Monitilora ramsayi)]
MVNHKKNKFFRVDEWTVEPVTLRLIRRGEVVKLEPQLMNALVVLIEKRGGVVTRENTLIFRIFTMPYKSVSYTTDTDPSKHDP